MSRLILDVPSGSGLPDQSTPIAAWRWSAVMGGTQRSGRVFVTALGAEAYEGRRRELVEAELMEREAMYGLR